MYTRFYRNDFYLDRITVENKFKNNKKKKQRKEDGPLKDTKWNYFLYSLYTYILAMGFSICISSGIICVLQIRSECRLPLIMGLWVLILFIDYKKHLFLNYKKWRERKF